MTTEETITRMQAELNEFSTPDRIHWINEILIPAVEQGMKNIILGEDLVLAEDEWELNVAKLYLQWAHPEDWA